MASGDERAEVLDIDGSNLRVAIISTRWNTEVVDRLAEGARRGFEQFGVLTIRDVSVPGAFELPFAAQAVAESGEVDAIVVVGAVIRGETTHYELVAGECGRGIMDVQLKTGVPIGMGVLTVENDAQADARSEGPGGHNVGEEAAVVAVELAQLRDNWSQH
jgi:6,7-dimethyl-8-ribityllumazine synthase